MAVLHRFYCIAYAQKPPLDAHADIFSRTRGLNFGLSLHLHSNFVYASKEGSSESTHLRRLALSLGCLIMR